MSATPCLRFVVPVGADSASRCWACGGTRAEHEGRRKPAERATGEQMDAALDGSYERPRTLREVAHAAPAHDLSRLPTPGPSMGCGSATCVIAPAMYGETPFGCVCEWADLRQALRAERARADRAEAGLAAFQRYTGHADAVSLAVAVKAAEGGA